MYKKLPNKKKRDSILFSGVGCKLARRWFVWGYAWPIDGLAWMPFDVSELLDVSNAKIYKSDVINL